MSALSPQRRLRASRWWFTLPTAALLFAIAVDALAHPIVPPSRRDEVPATWPVGLDAPSTVVIPVELVVEEDGSVSHVHVVAAPSPQWERAALEEAKGWRFSPALVHGVPTSARIRALVRFDHGGATEERQVAPAPPMLQSADEPSPSLALVPSPEPSEIRVRVKGRPLPRAASEVVRDRAQLQASPHRDGSELLLTVPGVFLTQHGGEGKAHQIFLRGYDAVHGQDIELWAGGAPVNDVSNVHGQGYADLHFLVPEAVHGLSAAAGPYDPRQGDFAIAGSARFDLGLEEEGFFAKQALGSFGGRRTLLAYRPPGQPGQCARVESDPEQGARGDFGILLL